MSMCIILHCSLLRKVVSTMQQFSVDYCVMSAEDVLTSPHDALWCSPDGSHLLFATFNDSEVRNFNFPWFSLSDSSPPEPGVSFPASRSVRYPTVRAEYYTPSHRVLFPSTIYIIYLYNNSILYTIINMVYFTI